MPPYRSQKGTMLGLPASTVYATSNALYIIAIGVAAICTLIIYQSSAIVLEEERKEFETYKVQAGKDVAAAYAEGVKAGREAGEAKTLAAEAGANAARANERAAVAGQAAEEARKEAAQAIRDAAQANLAAEKERLARATLEARIVAKRLTPDQSSRLTTALTAINSQVPVIRIITIGDQEAAAYGEDIVKAIAASGIRMERVKVGLMAPPLTGTFLSVATDSPLSKAFVIAGVPVITPPIASNPSNVSDPPQMTVGLKPPIQ